MLGSPRVITDSEGNVIAGRDFKPFGEEITNNTGERAPASYKYGAADNLRQKFTTFQRDEETGLDFAEARMYENRHGRFTAVDPLLASGKSAIPGRSTSRGATAQSIMDFRFSILDSVGNRKSAHPLSASIC